jgi:hypothetical protein
VRWKVALDGYLAPHAVIQEGDRILIYGPRSYDLGFQLYDLEGKLRGQGAYPSRDPSGSTRPVVMDAAHQLVYLTDQYNRLIAHRMSDGKEEWNLGLDSLGGLWVRPFFARRGQRFVVLGLDKSEVLPDRIQAPPNQALLSQIDLSPTNQLTPDHAVLNVAALAKLYVNRGATVAAMHDDELVFAVPGRLYLASSDLRARVALEGEFVPEALTLDERGWMYLVVSTSGGRALWVVAPDGKRTIAESLDAPEALPTTTPPIVGYDHTVYLQTSQTLSARDASGRVLWHKRMSARVAGAGVSTDDRLVAAVGSELLAVGTKGDAARLATPGPGDLVTAPVMSAAGEIFVASSDTLYCVSR